MILVEVAVNVPVRRTFSKRVADAAPPDLPPDDGPDAGEPPFQTYHYHLPAELEGKVRPGHLVWVPFGARPVQGIVVAFAAASPVPTKAVTRLARPEPLLSPVHLDLAAWIARYYVASLAQALKLFVPPGLLQKDPERDAVRAKRELQISLALPAADAAAQLQALGRETPQARVLARMLVEPERTWPLDELRRAANVKSGDPFVVLAERGLLTLEADAARLAVEPAAAESALQGLRGLDRYAAVIAALDEAGGPLWRSDLYARVDLGSNALPTLRTLQSHGLIVLAEAMRYRDPLGGRTYAPSRPPTLTPEQARVWEAIERQGFAALDADPNPVHAPRFLLHGVTGSGKTEIYLRAIERTLARGRQAIVLVPEIALTPQTVERFAGRFPGRVTVIHSQLSRGERYDVWRAVREGRFDVVVGPRSALFAPLPRLGLIVIDEEHEGSYKQSSEEWGGNTVFYDARTVAPQLADLTGSLLIAGSATPSLEAYWATLQGETILLQMSHRVLGHRVQVRIEEDVDFGDDPGAENPLYTDLPPVDVVDMRQELRAGNRNIFSRALQAELHTVLDNNEQAILFLNRRGTHTFILCRDCGHVESCPRCEVPLVYHERTGRLLCHHCDRTYKVPTVCKACNSKRIKFFGSGTEQVETLLRELEPRARTLRWDADTTTHKGSHADILAAFAGHQADVLVGTQMIAKGLDLPRVTLVGAITADVGLHLPDFRSSERTFQLLTQVAGRAGRSRRGGRVVIQTYTPQHYAIRAAAQHDYAAFVERELEFRRENGYPPVRRMARLVYWDKNAEKARAEAHRLAEQLAAQLDAAGVAGKMNSILGPAPAFFSRHRGFYRWQLLLRSEDPAAVLRQIDVPFGWRIDVDPVSVL